MIIVNIDKLLEDQERSISWLARKTGLTYSSLHALVNNETKSISFDTLEKVCIALDVSISDILELRISD